MPCSNDFDYEKHDDILCEASGLSCFSTFRKVNDATTWQQLFQIGVASVSFVAGAGLGREVLHDPLATAEGVLNWPIIVSQFAVIFTEVFLIDKKICTSHIDVSWFSFTFFTCIQRRRAQL